MEQTGKRSLKGRRVLFVDDEIIVCFTLAYIFKTHGYQTRTALSAEQALVFLPDWKPDAAILDLNLPQMNGIQLAQRVRQLCPECHILLFSARLDNAPVVEDDTAGAGIFEIAEKPIQPDSLLNWAEKYLR
jgi:DNA-binding NtrC family response regulator